MKKSIIQNVVDNFWEKTLFRILPHWILPNYFTILRIILLPFILYFLFSSQYVLALIFFIVASLFDTVDGSLARKRNLMTTFGAWLDPLADKLLIVFFLLFIISLYPYSLLTLAIIIIEIISIAVSSIVYFLLKNKKEVKSDGWGKVKMVLEVAGAIAVLGFIIFGNFTFIILSAVFFGLAIMFAFLSIINHIKKYNKQKNPPSRGI